MERSRSLGHFMTDQPVWRELGREVEQLFGAPMAESEEWNARRKRHIDRATTRCARTGMGLPLVGGMRLSVTHPDALTIAWLAVRRSARRRLDRGPGAHRVPPCSMPPTGTEAGPRVSRPHPHPEDDVLEAMQSATSGPSYPARSNPSRSGGE